MRVRFSQGSIVVHLVDETGRVHREEYVSASGYPGCVTQFELSTIAHDGVRARPLIPVLVAANPTARVLFGGRPAHEVSLRIAGDLQASARVVDAVLSKRPRS